MMRNTQTVERALDTIQPPAQTRGRFDAMLAERALDLIDSGADLSLLFKITE